MIYIYIYTYIYIYKSYLILEYIYIYIYICIYIRELNDNNWALCPSGPAIRLSHKLIAKLGRLKKFT